MGGDIGACVRVCLLLCVRVVVVVREIGFIKGEGKGAARCSLLLACLPLVKGHTHMLIACF